MKMLLMIKRVIWIVRRGRAIKEAKTKQPFDLLERKEQPSEVRDNRPYFISSLLIDSRIIYIK